MPKPVQSARIQNNAVSSQSQTGSMEDILDSPVPGSTFSTHQNNQAADDNTQPSEVSNTPISRTLQGQSAVPSLVSKLQRMPTATQRQNALQKYGSAKTGGSNRLAAQVARSYQPATLARVAAPGVIQRLVGTPPPSWVFPLARTIAARSGGLVNAGQVVDFLMTAWNTGNGAVSSVMSNLERWAVQAFEFIDLEAIIAMLTEGVEALVAGVLTIEIGSFVLVGAAVIVVGTVAYLIVTNKDPWELVNKYKKQPAPRPTPKPVSSPAPASQPQPAPSYYPDPTPSPVNLPDPVQSTPIISSPVEEPFHPRPAPKPYTNPTLAKQAWAKYKEGWDYYEQVLQESQQDPRVQQAFLDTSSVASRTLNLLKQKLDELENDLRVFDPYQNGEGGYGSEVSTAAHRIQQYRIPAVDTAKRDLAKVFGQVRRQAQKASDLNTGIANGDVPSNQALTSTTVNQGGVQVITYSPAAVQAARTVYDSYSAADGLVRQLEGSFNQLTGYNQTTTNQLEQALPTLPQLKKLMDQLNGFVLQNNGKGWFDTEGNPHLAEMIGLARQIRTLTAQLSQENETLNQQIKQQGLASVLASHNPITGQTPPSGQPSVTEPPTGAGGDGGRINNNGSNNGGRINNNGGGNNRGNNHNSGGQPDPAPRGPQPVVIDTSRLNAEQKKELLSLLLDFSIVGPVKMLVEAAVGQDLVTGQHLEWWQRALNALPGLGHAIGELGKYARFVPKLDEVLNSLSEQYQSFSNWLKEGQQIVAQYGQEAAAQLHSRLAPVLQKAAQFEQWLNRNLDWLEELLRVLSGREDAHLVTPEGLSLPTGPVKMSSEGVNEGGRRLPPESITEAGRPPVGDGERTNAVSSSAQNTAAASSSTGSLIRLELSGDEYDLIRRQFRSLFRMAMTNEQIDQFFNEFVGAPFSPKARIKIQLQFDELSGSTPVYDIQLLDHPDFAKLHFTIRPLLDKGQMVTRNGRPVYTIFQDYVEKAASSAAQSPGVMQIANEVAAIRKRGMQNITLDASGSESLGHSGDVVWAKCGFMGTLDAPTTQKIATELHVPNVTRIEQLMEIEARTLPDGTKLPSGEDWWSQEGHHHSFRGTFDTGEGSYSMRRLETYLKRKGLPIPWQSEEGATATSTASAEVESQPPATSTTSEPGGTKQPTNSQTPAETLDGGEAKTSFKPIKVTKEEFATNPEVQRDVYNKAVDLRARQQAFGERILAAAKITNGDCVSVLKRNSLSDFVEGVLAKCARNGYTELSQMDDIVRGRFNLSNGADVEAVANALRNQKEYPIKDFMGPRRPVPLENGETGYGYPRYHIIVQDEVTGLTHEWQIGTRASTTLFELKGVDLPQGLEINGQSKGLDLHDIEYSIFKSIQKNFPEVADEVGIPDYRSRLDRLAAETGSMGDATPDLQNRMQGFLKEATVILQKIMVMDKTKLGGRDGAEFIKQFAH